VVRDLLLNVEEQPNLLSHIVDEFEFKLFVGLLAFDGFLLRQRLERWGGIGFGGLDAKAALFWAFVGIPLAWGVWKTLESAAKIL
jgi:hypothetical protein